MINKLAQEIHENAKARGFFETPKNIGEMLCLIHSEVSEALEADRTQHYTEANMDVINGWVSDEDFKEHFNNEVKNSFEDELADVMIRVMDLAAFKGIDLEKHIHAKMRFNSLRAYKHGKKY